MNITETVTINTGGNIMGDFHKIENGGKLKMVGVFDEAIVGFSSEEPWNEEGIDAEMWVITEGEFRVLHEDSQSTDYPSADFLAALKQASTRWPLID
ncbi:MAG: hypothetical protein R3267_10850 [Paenisporosarcina sp.]|nr:hypothetical protein [Paenisporosarcina sp.]